MKVTKAMDPFSVDYTCSRCFARNCKLWRGYGRPLVCLDCLEALEGRSIDAEYPSASVGDWVPAVPVGDTFWGYTSVPPEGCAWWASLPLRGAREQLQPMTVLPGKCHCPVCRQQKTPTFCFNVRKDGSSDVTVCMDCLQERIRRELNTTASPASEGT